MVGSEGGHSKEISLGYVNRETQDLTWRRMASLVSRSEALGFYDTD